MHTKFYLTFNIIASHFPKLIRLHIHRSCYNSELRYALEPQTSSSTYLLPIVAIVILFVDLLRHTVDTIEKYYRCVDKHSR